MKLSKEAYENYAARMDLYENGDVWIGAGIAGVFLTKEEMSDLLPLIHAYEVAMTARKEKSEYAVKETR